MKVFKWVVGGVGIVVAVAHIGVLGHLMKDVPERQPVQIVYPPTNEYTTYNVTVNPDGSYSIDYRSHDPRVLDSETYTDSSNGAFGVGGRTTTTRNRQYVPGSQSETHTGVDGEGKPVRSEECIKAEGGGESNGALVGASIGTAAAPFLASIPYVGWLAAGWGVMLGQDMGSQVGGEIANTLRGC